MTPRLPRRDSTNHLGGTREDLASCCSSPRHGGLAVGAPLPVEAATATSRPSCDVFNDGGRYKHGAWQTAGNVLAQISTYSFAPGYEQTVTKEVTKANKYMAGARLGGSIDTQIGNRWIAQAEVHLSAELSASGEWSTTSKTTVTDYIVNNSDHNATFVFYRGSALKVWAPAFVSVCKNDDGGDSRVGHLYWERVGAVQSFSIPSAGALRCGAGTDNVNSVGRRALRVGCR